MDIYTMTTAPEDAPDKQTYVEVSFTKGVPTAIDGKKMGMVEMIETMNDIAGSNGYGRIDIIENRLVGVKSRECYEAPAAMALIVAHKALEDLCLERELLHNKLEIEHRWAIAVYNGQWFGPLKEAFDAFIGATQKYITGVVRLRFYKGNCVVVGRKSAYSLYDYRLATYDESDEFNHAAAAGFTELFGLSSKVWAANRRYTGTHGKGANAAMPAGTTNDLVEDGEVVLV
jgi:argininosuccinate synthase